MDKENFMPPDPDFQPPKKKKPKQDRFAAPTTESDMSRIVKGYTPANTQKNTDWARRVFSEWRAARNAKVGAAGELCPEDLFEKPEVMLLNHWIARFITEVRRQDGKPYPPRSIHQLLAGLQRYMLSMKSDAPKFLDRKDVRFAPIHGTCETIYRNLHGKGIGTDVRHAAVITSEDEEKLRTTGVVGCNTPKNLQRAVFFYVGKLMCIRGGEEQRKLGPSQFIRSSDPDCYTYVEHGSKNRNGGPQQLTLENKKVPVFAVPENIPKCLVFLLDFYFSKLPKFAFEKDVLYLRPKQTAPSDDSPWYDCAPIRKHTLATFVKDMCTEAGIEELKTNHLLRATGATCMFQANVPEKIIQKTTGHRSIEALRGYERIS